mmetsp:Transcript_21446/g.49492  ORF Transcript_21446/g.49492 Transcript_21446/m.49492 type:complete len:214 (+) Transcript_21446:295-936(+)
MSQYHDKETPPPQSHQHRRQAATVATSRVPLVDAYPQRSHRKGLLGPNQGDVCLPRSCLCTNGHTIAATAAATTTTTMPPPSPHLPPGDVFRELVQPPQLLRLLLRRSLMAGVCSFQGAPTTSMMIPTTTRKLFLGLPGGTRNMKNHGHTTIILTQQHPTSTRCTSNECSSNETWRRHAFSKRVVVLSAEEEEDLVENHDVCIDPCRHPTFSC